MSCLTQPRGLGVSEPHGSADNAFTLPCEARPSSCVAQVLGVAAAFQRIEESGPLRGDAGALQGHPPASSAMLPLRCSLDSVFDFQSVVRGLLRGPWTENKGASDKLTLLSGAHAHWDDSALIASFASMNLLRGRKYLMVRDLN